MKTIKQGQVWLTRAGLKALVIAVNEGGPVMPVQYIVRNELFGNLVFMDGRDRKDQITEKDLVELLSEATTDAERQELAGAYIAKWGNPFKAG